LIADFTTLAKLFKEQAGQLDELRRLVDGHDRFWNAIGKPVRKARRDTGYFTDRGKLVSLIEEYFNEDELIDMCFELGIFYDKLVGVGVRAKARSLIEYLERRAQIYKLLDECEQRRPHVEWPSL
jgi:hypothetical protein